MNNAVGIFKERSFDGWAKDCGLEAGSLRTAVTEMQNGLNDGDLGAGLFKKRIRPASKGKRGGFRTLVATNREDRWIFLHGFAKNQKANVTARELAALKKWSRHFLQLTPSELVVAEKIGELMKVKADG